MIYPPRDTPETARVAAALDRDLERAVAGWPPIVCFANDWFTDPTSKHHIMRAFGRHTEVLWVESSGMRRPNLTSGADLGRLVRKAKKALGGVRRVENRVTVVSPPAVPLPGVAIVSALNARLYQRAIRRALRPVASGRDPILWIYAPTVARYLDRLPRSGLVYHCVDRWWEFNDLDASEMRACHEILCQQADIVFASAQPLYRDCVDLARRTVLVPHGVEWEHFARAAFEDLPRPSDLPTDSRPIIGFFGLIQDWVDLELLAKVAAAYPNAHVVLLGRSMVDLAPLTGIRNLLILGQKAYAELPNYCAAFAVGLIPFLLNELTNAVNPIKLREYLSAGLPVVSTAMPEVEALGRVEGLASVRTHDEFVVAVGRALSNPRTKAERAAAAGRLSSESWLGRCLLMANETRRSLVTP